MSRRPAPTRTPYDFNKSILFPFKSGPDSAAFVFKSAALYALVSTILFFVLGRWIIAPFFDFFNHLAVLDSKGAEVTGSDIWRAFAVLGKVAIPLFLVSVLSWLVMAMIEAAFYRRVFRGENEALPWRFGRDEITVMLSQLIYGAVVFGLVILFYIFIIAMALLMDVGGDGLAVLAGLLMFVGVIGLIVLLVYVAIRLSPIAPLSFYREKLSFGEAWTVTKGRFWPVFASFIIVAVLASIINYAVQIIAMLGIMGSAGSWVEEMENLESSEPQAVMEKIMDIITQPSTLIMLAVFLFLYGLVQSGVRLLYSGVVANAVELYREDLGDTDLEVFD